MKMVSVIGDSISTYSGYNPEGYAVFYDYNMQQKNGLSSVYDTWWAKVNQALRAYICVNNSYSGSKVTGLTFPAATSAQRTGALHTQQYSPDIILIYIGFNDFGSGVPIQKNGFFHQRGQDLSCFADAYSALLSRVKVYYPNAKVVCGTLMRTRLAGEDGWQFPEHFAGTAFEAYNQAIRAVCKKQNCYLADIAALNMRYETLDGTHPTQNGHTTLYKAWVMCLSELGFL